MIQSINMQFYWNLNKNGLDKIKFKKTKKGQSDEDLLVEEGKEFVLIASAII